MIPDDLVKRFAALFRGNPRSYGEYVEERKPPARTVKGNPVTDAVVRSHLEGGTGLGVVPILDTGECWFAAMDIDTHNAPDLDLVALEASVREKDLPLTVCRSKSGGAHLYLFGSEPLPAKLVRATLAKWATDLGHGGCEVFPKQDKLPDVKGEGRQLGNWLNLCYFDVENPDCKRYAVEGGKRLSFEFFLDIAENRRISAPILVEKAETTHSEAPPCIQSMITNGVQAGQRNEALYNIVVYLKQAFPETWRDRAYDFNARVFDKPLSHVEAKRTIASAGRRDYRYKCKEEPCKSLCKSAICVTRKYGITPQEKGELEMGAQPAFGPLRKYMTDPVRWVLVVDGKDVLLSTVELMSFARLREAVADSLTRLIPPMKNDQWQAQLHQLMESAELIEAPEEASVSGLIRNKLQEFVRRADLSNDGKDIEARADLLHGSPVVQERDGVRCVMFRAMDFVDFLKKSKSEELKGTNLWMALRSSGVEHARVRAGSSYVSVWIVPLSGDDVVQIPDIDMEPEI